MARIQNILFGKLAVSTRFITEQQLDECLQEQRRIEGAGEQPPRLGEILEQKGYLTKQQIRSILETMASMQRRLFGEIAISFHFITLEQLQTALDVQRFLKSPMDSVPLFGQALIAYRQFLKSTREGGPVPKIGEILVAMGYLKEHQVQVILGEQNKKIVQCLSCGAGLNIGNYGEGQKLRCGQCSSVLMLKRDQFGELGAVLPEEEEPLPQVTRRPTEVKQMLPVRSGVPDAASPLAPATLPATSVTTRPSQVAKSPTVFGDFTIQNKLGQDSTGTLYKAHQVSKNRPVVVKIMNQAVMQDAAFAKRFIEEAKKVAGLVHPNIKKIYAIGQVDNRAYMAMEFVDGESVHGILTRQTRIHHTQALRIGKKIAEALKYAWDTGKIIHGDIRPSNILVLKTGEVMLSNLGLATKTAENILTIAKSGQLAPFYLAPEVVTEDRSIDFRSDIYSLGATLYHMVAGRPPYQGQSPFEVLVRLTEERVAPLKFFDATIPDAVCIVVEKMLAVEPDERYASYDDLIHDLSNIEEVSADVDASMLLGERPSKNRKTTVQLLAAGGAEASAAPANLSDSKLRKKTTTVIRTDSGDIQTIPTKSRTPIFVWIGVAAVVLIGGFFILSSQSASNQEDTEYQRVLDDVRQLEVAENYDGAIAKLNEYLTRYPGSSRTSEVRDRIDLLEQSKISLADRALDQIRNDIERTAMEQGIPAAQRYLDPGQLPPVLNQPKYAAAIERLKEQIKELGKKIFEEGKNAAWALAKEKNDAEGARAKFNELMNRVPEYAEVIQGELRELEKWIEAEKQRQRELAAQKREEESKRHLDQVMAQVDELSKAWDLDKAVELCGREMGNLIDKHQADLKKVLDDTEALRGLRQQILDYWLPILTTTVDAPPESDPRPLLTLGQAEYRMSGLSSELVEMKDKDGRVLRRPWKDLPPQLFYEKIAAPATAASSSGDHHLALGLMLFRNLAFEEAEKEFVAARDQGGKDVDIYLRRLDEAFFKEAEKCLADAKTFQKGKKPQEAIRCCLRMWNEFAGRSYFKQHEGEIVKLTEEVFREATEGADYHGFGGPDDLGAWKQEGEGAFTASGVLTAGGKKATLSIGAKSVECLQFLMQIPDPKSRLTITIGDFKAQFVPWNKPPKVTLAGKRGMNSRNFQFDARRWFLVRLLFEDAKMKCFLDDREIGSVPAVDGSRDDVSIQIEGAGGTHEGKALLDHLTILCEK